MTIILAALLILLFIVIFLLAVSSGRKGDKDTTIYIKKQLDLLSQKSLSNNPNELKSSLIDADKLLDYCLKHKHIKGETLGERLKNARNSFDHVTYNKVWEAHKVRNKLVHELDYKVSAEELKHYISSLKSGINKLI